MEQPSKPVFKIDIENVLQSKAPKYHKRIPRFVINYIKRIIHQDDINGIIVRNNHRDGVDFMQALVSDEFKVNLRVEGEEFIPKEGRFVFVSNHPLGGLDGICLSAYIGEKCDRKIKCLVNDVLLNIKNLESIFVPINKYGSQAKNSTLAINEAYASDNQIITFPAGLCSRKIGREITDLPWQKNVVVKAVEHRRDIIPVHFEGRNSNFFYNLSKLRKKIGVKFNFELVYLPDEMFKNKGATFGITFGKPIPWQSLDKSKTPAQWAKHIREQVYTLKKQPK
ncbi:MAG: 1-acyl-sn-glycerol-3-phosphate acyltransferase [Dysgonamonadaceae bacterium]|jgi:putative hemolysin|nr:1-acyl-sn-glycerol-3-phosphate acyltransferase [Dysgonamonadaceae bacterium]